MGARSYILGQFANDFNNAVEHLDNWQNRVIQTQYRNTSEILSNKINEDLENKVYSNPNTDKWEDSSNEVFNDNLSYIDSLENVRDETKNLLREDLNNRKLLYQNTVKSQMENTNIANWQAETNESINLNASNSEKSLTDCVEDYSKNLNSTKILLDERGLDYLSVNEVAENIIPKKSEQYISNSLNALPNNFLKEETDLNGNTVHKAITSDSISDDVISGIENEMSKITRTDWKMPDSQKADIKSTTVKLYDQKLTVLNTAATNNSKIYAGEIEENINKGVLTDTASMESYYKDNYPPFIVNTVGKEIINYGKSANDTLRINSYEEKGFVSITGEDINNLENDSVRNDFKINVSTAKLYYYTAGGMSLEQSSTELKKTGIELNTEEQNQVYDSLLKTFASEGFDSDSQGSKAEQVKEILSKRALNTAVQHSNSFESLYKQTAKRIISNTPESAEQTNNEQEYNKANEDKLINEVAYAQIKNLSGDNAVKLTKALSSAMDYTEAFQKGLIPSIIRKEDYDLLYNDILSTSSKQESTVLGKIQAQKLVDVNLPMPVIKMGINNLIESGQLSRKDAESLTKNSKFKDTTLPDNFEKETKQMISDVAKNMNLSLSERTVLENDVFKSVYSNFTKTDIQEFESNPEKFYDNLSIKIKSALTELQSTKFLNEMEQIGNTFETFDSYTSIDEENTSYYHGINQIQNQLNDKKIDTFMDEVEAGKWSLFIDKDILDSVGKDEFYSSGIGKLTNDEVRSEVLKSLYGDVKFEDLSKFKQTKVLINTNYILGINSYSALFQNTFKKPASESIRIGNRQAFKVEEGIYAYPINSDTTRPLNKGELDSLGETTYSSWCLFKPKVEANDINGNSIYGFDFSDTPNNSKMMYLSDLSTKNDGLRVKELEYKANRSGKEFFDYDKQNGLKERDHYWHQLRSNAIAAQNEFSNAKKSLENQENQIKDMINKLKYQEGENENE